jgi:hypothetical protein
VSRPNAAKRAALSPSPNRRTSANAIAAMSSVAITPGSRTATRSAPKTSIESAVIQ